MRTTQTTPPANAPCPCGSGRKAKGCCLPLLDGASAPTPEALMRSRYTAYACGAVAHLMRTTDPAGPHHPADTRRWAEELRQYCAQVRFLGLQVLEASAEGDHGQVAFRATFEHGGRSHELAERSRFRRLDGRWVYTDGGPLDANRT